MESSGASARVQGTIFPAPNFNPVMDAQMLGGALQGFDCNKDMLIDILTQRSNAQRQMIAGAYQSMFGRWVSLCSPGCPGTRSVDQAGLELRNPPASASQVLGLKACATTPGSTSLSCHMDLVIKFLERRQGISTGELIRSLLCYCRGEKMKAWPRRVEREAARVGQRWPVLLARSRTDLIADLKEQLSSHFKEVMVGLMYPPPSYDAHELWHAMKGAGTDENCLIEILASRTNGEIFQMREAYYLQYSNNLQEDIYSETSGHFRDTLMNLVQGNREDGYSDPAMAAQDAMVLWEACQQKTGEHKTMMQMILCNKSYPQLWLVEFQSISGQDLVDAINDCYDGYFQELLIAIVVASATIILSIEIIMQCDDSGKYFVVSRTNPAILLINYTGQSMDFGFHNKTVIRILIARSEIDLMTIRKRYKERFGKSLFHDIKNFASGHYEKALLAICAGDVQDC
ncbi:Annexin A10 [Apodemus speciosus]|uniref:Annexin n=1 Tax=Apodemus speciosus TaxID=105296 RepID=A0ABQ0F295_APOSI